MPSKFAKAKHIRVGCLIIAVALGAFVCRGMFSDYYTYQKINLPNKRKLIISGASSWEISQDIYYQIQDRDGLSGRHLIGWMTPDTYTLEFKTVTADGENIVGLVDDYRPDVLLILLDFKGSRSREEMANIIRNETKRNYILGYEVKNDEKKQPHINQYEGEIGNLPD